MPDFLFPLDNAEKYLRGATEDLKRDGDRITWRSCDGISELTVRAVQEKTFDGLLVSELVTLTHTSELLNRVTSEMAVRMNTWATTSSLVTADSDGPNRLASKVGIFSSDHAAAERVYAPLLCTQAALMGWHAALLTRGQFRLNPGQSCGLSKTDEPPPFDMADYEAAKSLTDRRGFLGTLGDHHYTVEFPWGPGAKSHLFRSEVVRDQWAKDHSESSNADLDQMAGKTSLFQPAFPG